MTSRARSAVNHLRRRRQAHRVGILILRAPLVFALRLFPLLRVRVEDYLLYRKLEPCDRYLKRQTVTVHERYRRGGK